MDSTSNRKKQPRRRVADNISKSPAPVDQQSPATKLLAALSKAQGKSSSDASTSRQSGHGQKFKAEQATPKTKAESKKRAGGSHLQSVLPAAARGTETSGSVGARMSRNQLNVDEAGPSTSNSRRYRENSCTQNQPPATESYSMWSVSPTKPSQSTTRIPPEVLQDLAFRFLANIPDEEKSDKVRMCFQVELAHWFYIDFYCKQQERKDCAQMGMREFSRQIFKHCEELAPYAAHVDQVIDEWRWYKSTVPTYGAILLDESLNHVLLVQGFYASKNSWGFPKGKVNEGEEPRNCAIREVFEETGFNFGDHRPRGGEKKLQKFVNETMVRLYIVPDVPTDFPFAPQTRNEIRKIQWFSVWELPTDRNDQVHRMGNLSNHNFYTVMPFIQDLQKYIIREQERRAVISTDHQKSSAPKLVYGDTQAKAHPNIPHSDISVVMDALFSSSVFPTVSGAAKNKTHQSSIPVLTETVPTISTGIQNLSSQMTSSYIPRDLALESSTSRFQPTDNIANAPHPSHFRPLDHNPISKGVMNVLTGSTSKIPRGSTEKASPRIAHPIAIPAQHAPPPLTNRPVYVAPKEKQGRISLSETSAFTAFKSPSMSSSIDIASGAADKIEMELHKLLCAPNDGDDIVDADLYAENKTPTGFLDSFSPETDLGSEFGFMSCPSREANHVPSAYVTPYKRADEFVVQLCDAWKDFRLDRTAIFAGLPGFEAVN